MKLYKKVKYKNGKRDIILLGMKIFSYEKKPQKVLNGYDYAEMGRKLGVKIGEESYICSGTVWGNEPYFIEIGKNCLLSTNITFLTHDRSTHTSGLYAPPRKDFEILGKIKIGDNCFIGNQTIILPNVKIGNNCVIGAGSVVTKNVPDEEVWAGNPAHFIKNVTDLAHKHELIRGLSWQIELQNIKKEIENKRL